MRGSWLTSLNRLSGGINPGINVSVVDRNLTTPYQDEWTVSFERELAAELALRLTYVRRDFRDQLQDVEINHIPGDYGRCALQRRPSDPTIVSLPATPDNPTGGDGTPDDCVGKFEQLPNPGGDDGPFFLANRPDGFLDTYILNPGWGQIYLVGNFNTAKYQGVVLELDRRFYRGWDLNASYTWSRAVGDAEDFQLILGDDRTTLDDERGSLSYDQRHVVKLNATTVTPWGFRLGGTVTWESGLPYSMLVRQLSADSQPPQYLGFGAPEPRVRLHYVTHQRNDQRNEPFWTFNVKVQKEMSLRKGRNLSVTAEIFNLLNNDSLRIFNQTNDTTSAVRRFGRQFQVGMRLAF